MDTRKYQLFKTELCRNWQEMGECRYGKKCRFAHGQQELKSVHRHARYKTEICKTFHLTGTCLYGVRCTFLHDEHALDPSFLLYSDIYAKKEQTIWSGFTRRYSASSSSSSSSVLFM